MEKKRKYILVGLSVLAVAGTGWLVYNQVKKTPNNFPDSFADLDAFTQDSPTSNRIAADPSIRKVNNTSGFPIKKGSRGNLVRSIQSALITRYGKEILPKYGADGHWGSEMQKAMEKLGLPTQISEELLKKVLAAGAVGLSGVRYDEDLENQLITLKGTSVWNKKGERILVPAQTIIGEFIAAKNEVTHFKTLDNQLLFVHTSAVRYA